MSEPLTKLEALAEVTRAALDWIDAVPSDVVATLPAMPGFDRDAAENTLAATLRLAGEGLSTAASEPVAWMYRWLAGEILAFCEANAELPTRETLIPIGAINAFRSAILAHPPAADPLRDEVERETVAKIVAYARSLLDIKELANSFPAFAFFAQAIDEGYWK